MPERRTPWVPLYARYYLDPRLIEAGPDAELLYVRALAFAKGHDNDGRLNRRQLGYVAQGIRQAAKQAQRLVEVGAWVETEHGWAIAAWPSWNASADEIEKQRKARHEIAIRGNHQRWHVGPEGKPSDDCPLCPVADPFSIRKAIGGGSSGDPVVDPY